MTSLHKVAETALCDILKLDDDYIEMLMIASPGSSGNRVFIYKDSRTNMIYAVKCAIPTSRVSIFEEQKNKEFLTQYIGNHIPKTVWHGMFGDQQIMITEASGVDTLHNALLHNNISSDLLTAKWKNVLETVYDLWQKSNSNPFVVTLSPRNYTSRVDRISNGIEKFFKEKFSIPNAMDLKIKINGEFYPSFADSINKLKDYHLPQFGVTCHGDPQPSNIVIGKNETDKADWYFVDWEWAGDNHDWRMMVSHFWGWWFTRLIVLKKKPTMVVSKEQIEIEYDSYLPEHFEEYLGEIRNLFFKMTEIQHETEDIKQVNKFLTKLYLGEIRFINNWGRNVFAPYLLGQGILTINNKGFKFS